MGPTPAVPVAEAVTQNICASEETENESFNCAFEERERESAKASNPNCASQEIEHESFKP